MDRLTTLDFDRLLTAGSAPRVSIYIPTRPGGIEARADALRLKNAVKKAQNLLDREPYKYVDANALLKPAYDLLDDSAFWESCSRGLAILISPQAQYIYRLPIDFRESVTVAADFRIRPLLSALDKGAGYVVAISQDHTRLYRITQQDCDVVYVPGLQENMREALDFTSVDRGLQCHSVRASSKRKQGAVFHGQAAGHDTEKQDLKAYCRQVDKVISGFLKSTEAPLLLACVGYLAPIYREVNHFPKLLSELIEGSPDHLSVTQIQELAWPILSPHLFHEVADQLIRFKELRGSKRASIDLSQIVRAACDGHVDQLFFDDHRDVWGRYEKEECIVDVHDVAAPNDEELIELAVSATLRHRGTVHAIAGERLPSVQPMAAILRNVPSAKTVSVHQQA